MDTQEMEAPAAGVGLGVTATLTYPGDRQMADKLDRALQRALLQKLSDAYPASVVANELTTLAPGTGLRVNIAYMDEHGLVDANFFNSLSDGPILGSVKITARGLDFMADDGGLSSILGVVTVKLHEDTLKDLVAARILTSDLSEPDKKRFLDQLRELPGETTKHLVLKLVDAGLQNWPQALQLLQTVLPG